MASDRHRLPVRLILRPGQNGTEKLQQKYGDRLVSVRYRYDEEKGIRYKTRASKFAEFVAWKVNTKIWRIMLIGLELYVPSKVQKAVKNKADLALKE